MRQINLVFWVLFRGKIQVSWTFRDWDKNCRNLPHFTSFGQPKRQNWDEVKWGKMRQFALILPHSGSQKRQNWDEVKWGWPPPQSIFYDAVILGKQISVKKVSVLLLLSFKKLKEWIYAARTVIIFGSSFNYLARLQGTLVSIVWKQNNVKSCGIIQQKQ